MTLNLRIPPRKPHPCNTRAQGEHYRAVFLATTEQLKREQREKQTNARILAAMAAWRVLA